MAELPHLPQQGDRLLVTLRQPICVMLNQILRTAAVFEGELVLTSERFQVFKAMRLFVRAPDGARDRPPPAQRYEVVTMIVNITVATDNIAGVLPAPKSN